MCLDKLTEFPVKRNYGWKVFKEGLNGKNLYPIISINPNNIPFPVNKWFKDKKSTDILVDDFHYPTGFHIFVTKKTAKSWEKVCGLRTIRKVRFRNVMATGTQIRCQVIVAKEIFIEKR